MSVYHAMSKNFGTALDELDRRGWRDIVQELRAATHPRLKYELAITGFDETGARQLLPPNAGAYEHASLRVNAEAPETEAKVVHNIVFGYNLRGEFRRTGVAHYAVVDEGDVLEMGFGSKEALEEFVHHLRGRQLTEAQTNRIVEIQEAVFAYLRGRTDYQEALAIFAQSRGWPEGLADEAQLAYFDARTADLEAWAETQGFTPEEMSLAGWYQLQFESKTGAVSYSVRDSHVIRIPYFRNGRLETWRTRNLRAKQADTHKYTSWPLNRSIEDWDRLEHKLYNGWRLHEATGKTLIITEGEFKCLVATHAGTLTVGIPGITEVDDRTIRALVEARAAEYIIVLDRDPQGKGIMRVDGITDSERAAYLIAVRLIEAGAERVRVASIPNVRQGEKVGLDDLIIDLGPAALKRLIRDACSPHQYAVEAKLNPVFCGIIRARQTLTKALRQYEISVSRGGTQLPAERYAEAQTLTATARELYDSYLKERFMGARRIDQPDNRRRTLYRQSRLSNPERKLARTQAGIEMPLHLFNEDIVQLDFYPADVSTDHLLVLSSFEKLPFTASELLQLARGKRLRQPRQKLAEKLLKRGADTLGTELDLKTPRSMTKKLMALVEMLTVGKIVGWFPTDEYHIERQVTLLVRHQDYWEELTTLPIVVTRKSTGFVVALVTATASVTSERVHQAQDASHRISLLAGWFLRERRANDDHQVRYDRLVQTLWPYWFERNRQRVIDALAPLGITAEVIDRQGLLFLSRHDLPELKAHFIHRSQLNQAAEAGLLKRLDRGDIVSRFMGDVVVLPIRNAQGTTRAMRVFPLNLADTQPPALPPQPKFVHHLHGKGKNLAGYFDPELHLYMEEQLGTAEGATLVVTHHELDALALASATNSIVALNGSFDVSDAAVQKLAESRASTICFVLSGGAPRSAYDAFDYDGVPGVVKEIHDLAQRILTARPVTTAAPTFRVFVAAGQLTNAVRQHGAETCLEHIATQAVNLDDYLRWNGFGNACHDLVRRFLRVSSRLMDYLEMLALPELLDSRPIDWWVRESERLYAAASGATQSQFGRAMQPLESYVQQQLGLPSSMTLAELVSIRQTEGKTFMRRTIYAHRSSTSYEPPQTFIEQFTMMQSGEPSGEPFTNVLLASRQATVPERNSVNLDAKSAVLQFLAQRLRRAPQPHVTFAEVAEGFSCTVRIALDDKVYDTTQTARRKKTAEAAAYQVIGKQMQAEGALIEVDESTVDAQQAPLAKALALLNDKKSNSNSVGKLNEFAQKAQVAQPLYTIMTATPVGGYPRWEITVSIALPDGTKLASTPKSDSNKQAGRQVAARELLELLQKHYEQ